MPYQKMEKYQVTPEVSNRPTFRLSEMNPLQLFSFSLSMTGYKVRGRIEATNIRHARQRLADHFDGCRRLQLSLASNQNRSTQDYIPVPLGESNAISK